MKEIKIQQRLDNSFIADSSRYISDLRDMIHCRTISAEKYLKKEEFESFDKVIEKNYPLISSKAEKIQIDSSIMFRIAGTKSGSPLILMSHRDVVHEGRKKWKAPPYEGKIINGKMYGRGTFDCKGSLCTIFEAVESLLAENYIFENDLYIFPSSTEEIAGPDAPDAVEYFRNLGIVPGLVVDEGGALLKNPFPSSKKRFAMIGAVERSSGVLIYDAEDEKTAKNLIKTVRSSRPGKFEMYPEVKSLVHGLAENLDAPVGTAVKFLDRHSNAAKFLLTHVGADARSFCGTICGARVPDEDELEELEKKHGKLNNPVRVNISGNYYNKIDDLVKEIKVLTAGLRINLKEEKIKETYSPVSEESAGYKFVGDTAKLVFKDTAVLPYPVLGRTDCRYFIGCAEDVIRFIPIEISLFQMMKFHCPNENIYTESLKGAVEFYRELIKQYRSE